MDANIKGALAQIDQSYRAFEHRGQPMTKELVRMVLEDALAKGYEFTSQITDKEVDDAIEAEALLKSLEGSGLGKPFKLK